jgi:site-specific DNA-cytosine methylase
MTNEQHEQDVFQQAEPNSIGGAWETKPGWAVDPSDGERVYVTGRGRLGTPDHQVSVPVYEDDDIATTYTTSGRAQVLNDSPEAVEDRQQLAYYQEQHRQKAQTPPDVTEMNPVDVMNLINHAASDTKFQEFYESYDASKSRVQLTPQQKAQVDKFSRMFGSTWQNASDPGVRPSQIMAAIEFYGLAGGSRKQANAQANAQAEANNELPPEIREQAQNIASQLAGAWQLRDGDELDYRFQVVSTLVNLLSPEGQQHANKDPVRGAQQLWKQFTEGKFDRGLAARNLPTSSDYRRRLRG